MKKDLDLLPCGILSLGNDGIILFANRMMCDLLSYSEEELAGNHVDFILSAGAKAYYQTYLFPMLRMRGTVEEVYLSLQTAEDEPLPVLINGVRQDEGEKISLEFAIIPMRRRSQFEDELLQAKRAAEHAERAKERFLHMMSHDLKTPLTAIRMASEMLSSGFGGPVTEIQQRELERIKAGSGYVLRLVKDILTFARLERGRANIPMENVPLEGILSTAESLISHLLQEAEVNFTCEEYDQSIIVFGAAEQIQQILLNLLTNAIRYTESQGHVTLKVKQEDDQVHIVVGDTGEGIPNDRLEQIFSPFVRLDESSQDMHASNLGLGLAISRELARAMGGDVTVDSEVSEGTEFTVSLLAGERSQIQEEKVSFGQLELET